MDKNNIFAFFTTTEGNAVAVISTSTIDDWNINLKKIFSISDAEVIIINENEWVTAELKSKTIEELEGKWQKTRIILFEKLSEKGVPSSALQNLKNEIKVIPNPISGLVVFAFLYVGNLIPKDSLSKEGIQIKFFSAVDASDVELAEKLINMGANVNSLTNEKYHPLWIPMMKKNVSLDMIRLLVSKGSDVNYQGGNGMTALFAAAVFDLIDVAKILLENGANKSLKDNKGYTASYYARQKGNLSVAKLLE